MQIYKPIKNAGKNTTTTLIKFSPTHEMKSIEAFRKQRDTSLILHFFRCVIKLKC